MTIPVNKFAASQLLSADRTCYRLTGGARIVLTDLCEPHPGRYELVFCGKPLRCRAHRLSHLCFFSCQQRLSRSQPIMEGNPAAITEWPTPLTLSPAPSLLMVSYSGTESLTLAPQLESASGFRDGTPVRHLNRSAIRPQKQGDPCDVKQSCCSCQSNPSDMSLSSKRQRRCSESSSSVLINSDDVEDPKQVGKRATKVRSRSMSIWHDRGAESLHTISLRLSGLRRVPTEQVQVFPEQARPQCL